MLKRIKTLRSKFNQGGVSLTIYFVLSLILINTFLTYQYKQALDRDLVNQKKYDEIKYNKDNILVNLNNIDMSIRGYVLVENPAFLATLKKIKDFHEVQFKELNETVSSVGLRPSELSAIQGTVDQYFVLMDTVVKLTQKGNYEKAKKIIKDDPGTAVWERYVQFSKVIDPLIAEEKLKSQKAYNDLLTFSIIFNIILFAIGIPSLIFASARLKRNAKKQLKLYKEMDESNRELIFDSNEAINVEDEKVVFGSMINNLNKTAEFIKAISNGNFEVDWEGINDENKAINTKNIAGSLLLMRNQMKTKQEETERQKWVSEGLTELSELLRDYQNDFRLLTEKTVSFLVNYIHAQQGGLFVLNEEEDIDKPFLELISCYAFNRKKHLSKRIEIGEGLVGQTYLEAEPVYLTKVPESYISISSGLGDANPSCLLVLPMIHNEKVESVLEIASFKTYDSFVMDFLEKASKTIAASIVSIRTNEKTKLLLEKSQQQAEEMRAQEEEMRQNMEELEATQEEMKRKELELRGLLEKTQSGSH